MYGVTESPCILRIYMDHNYKTTQMLGRFLYSRNKSTYELSDYKIHRSTYELSDKTNTNALYLSHMFAQHPIYFG